MKDEKVKRKKSAKRRTIVIIFSVICLIIAYVMYRGNYLEYLEIGKDYIGAFSSKIKYRSITIIISFLWIFGLMYITNKRIQKGLKPFFAEEKKEMPKYQINPFHS